MRNDYLNFYKENSFTLIPIKARAKAPEINGWQNRRPSDFDLAEFDNEANIGIVLGDASGGLVDIDLDCEEVIKLAPLFLPSTNFRFGRPSKPDSHWFYRCEHPAKTIRFTSSSGRTLLECRANGGQTVVPPSLHPSGEPIVFSKMEQPAKADFDELVTASTLMAVSIELYLHWQNGSRHELALAVAGALLRAGVSRENVFKVIKGICRLKGDEEAEDRLRCIQSTADRIAGGEPATGWPTLSDFIGARVCDHISKWFQESELHSGKLGTIRDALFTRDSLNDAGNAERTKSLFGCDVIYVPQLRHFLCWDGVSWIEDADNLKVQTLCLRCVDHHLSQLRTQQLVTFNNEKVATHLRRSKDRAKLNAQYDLLKAMVVCDASKLDADENKIGCLNGIINLIDGSCSSPEKSAKITKLLNVEYDPDAVCPVFEKLVSDMLGRDDAKIEFLQKLAGYWLTGSTKFHVLPILVGLAATGKSTFVNAIKGVLGEYATDMMPDTLFENTANAVAQYDLATLRGCRFVVAQEAESNQRLRASVVKALTGGDTLKVRLPYQNPRPMLPSAKFLMVANVSPNLDALDSGLKRRVVIIECGEPLPWNKRDVDLAEKLRSEKAGILNWMLRGWSEVRQSGLDVPDVIRRATKQLFNDKNEIAAFVDECVERAAEAKTPIAELYEAYCSYCIAEGIVARSQREFGQLLRTAFKLEQGRSGSTRFWRRISLRT